MPSEPSPDFLRTEGNGHWRPRRLRKATYPKNDEMIKIQGLGQAAGVATVVELTIVHAVGRPWWYEVICVASGVVDEQ
jgi:hypothetical protein